MKLKVMTFNLLYHGAVNPAGAWSARLPLVLDVLRSGADIIAVQEATSVQIADMVREMTEFVVVSGPESGETRLPLSVQAAGRFLRGAFGGKPRHHAAVPVVDHGLARRGEHCAILYRADRFEMIEGNAFWLSHEPDIPGSVLHGSWLPRVVNWARLRERESHDCVTVFNAHLDFLPWSPLRSARILRQSLDSHWNSDPQILMGDFNAAPNSAAYRHLSAELKRSVHPSLTDAWQAAEARTGPEGTFHGGTGRIRWTGRLDRIFFRPDLRVEHVTTITHHQGSVYPSDHYPVMAELELPQQS
ncbi:MAG: endonuclease/exonuclease/phosphatase family protein [Armatimonadota bacterium]